MTETRAIGAAASARRPIKRAKGKSRGSGTSTSYASRMAPPTLRLDLVVEQEEGRWTAICIQLDLVATGETETEAFDRLQEICIEQIIHTLNTDNFGNLFRPPNRELLYRMFTARTLGYLHVELDKKSGGEAGLDLEFQRLVTA